MKRGLLFVVSGPSGSGKGTIVLKAREKREFLLSVSATTRQPRKGEEDGVHYYFISKEDFESRIAEGRMLEYTRYSGSGQYYGTPKDPVEKALASGKDVLLEIEIDGAMQIKKQMPEAILIFVTAPSLELLRARLIGRGSETEESLENRLIRAKEELSLADRYDYLIVNEEGKSDEAVESLLEIARAESMRMERNTEIINSLI